MSLQEIVDELQGIRKLLEERLPEKKPVPFAEAILELPGHLQQTMIALTRQPDCAGTASQIAIRTRRKRAVESNYLNQLANLNYVSKTFVGRRAVFQINRERLQK